MNNYTKNIFIYTDEIGSVDYVSHMGSDLTYEDKKLINYLIKHKHTSTLEVTFRFTVPLFIRSQHHRHRTWSYNEISRRYTDTDIKFYEPCGYRIQHKSNRQASYSHEVINPMLSCGSDCDEMVSLHHQMSLDLFRKMIEANVCKEQARGVLPQNMYTQYYGTVNLNNLLKFIDLRMHDGAQWEIQQLAKGCLTIATDLWPVTIDAYKTINNIAY
jgi:thymidylate synthase (FAD)